MVAVVLKRDSVLCRYRLRNMPTWQMLSILRKVLTAENESNIMFNKKDTWIHTRLMFPSFN